MLSDVMTDNVCHVYSVSRKKIMSKEIVHGQFVYGHFYVMLHSRPSRT